jgi:hypothetical protein
MGNRLNPGRNLSLDALRGIMILILTVDHMGGVVKALTWQTFGFVTALPGFLFLSGFIVAKVYGGAIVRSGIGVGTRKIAKRTLLIYAWHSVSVIATIGVGVLAHNIIGIGESERYNLFVLYEKFSIISSSGFFFDVLPLYIILLSFAPLLLWIGLRSPSVVLGLGVLIWAVSDHVPFSMHNQGEALNVFVWQVVFLLGITCGLRSALGRPIVLPSWFIISAFLVAALLFALRWEILDQGIVPNLNDLTSRDDLGPIRLLNIVCVLALGSVILPLFGPYLERCRMLVHIGQNSLQAFALQIIIVFYLLRPQWWVLSLDLPPAFEIAALLTFDGISLVLVVVSTYAVRWGRVRLKNMFWGTEGPIQAQ